MNRLFLFLLLLMTGSAVALETPANSPFDARVKFVNYNPQDVVSIVAHYGFQTHIEFDEAETVKYIALGDPGAWEISPKKDHRNHLFLKPVGDRATTNLTVVTVRGGKFRSYQFLLRAHWPKYAAIEKVPDMYFHVQFRYPDDERLAKVAQNNFDEARKALRDGNSGAPQNRNYWVCGSDSIAPDEAYDDGTFTFFKFSANREIPAIFHINDDGSEALVNPYVEGDWHIVQRVSKKFALRKGSAVACVTNESFDPNGVRPATKTVSPNVERILKGGAQ